MDNIQHMASSFKNGFNVPITNPNSGLTFVRDVVVEIVSEGDSLGIVQVLRSNEPNSSKILDKLLRKQEGRRRRRRLKEFRRWGIVPHR